MKFGNIVNISPDNTRQISFTNYKNLKLNTNTFYAHYLGILQVLKLKFKIDFERSG
jgi:hypothetical protein